MKFSAIGLLAALLLAGLYNGLKKWGSALPASHLDSSSLKSFEVGETSWRVQLAPWPQRLYLLSLLMLLSAMVAPHLFYPLKRASPLSQEMGEGRLLMLVLDRSGSMNEPAAPGVTKMELLKPIVEEFIRKRPEDLIGLSAYARVAQILSPPTLDHDYLLKQVEALKTVSGYEQEGTAIGYALFKTAHLLAGLKEEALSQGNEAPYDIKGAALILVTDGLQEPHPLDKENAFRSIGLEEAAAWAKQNSIRIYIVNVDPKWLVATYQPNLNEMKRAAAMTGGKYFHASDPKDVSDFMQAINETELSRLKSPSDPSSLPFLFSRFNFYTYLMAASLALFLTAFLLQSTALRRVG